MKDSQLEKLGAFTLSLKHRAMAQFKQRPTTKRQYLLYGLLALSPMLACFLIQLVLMQVFASLRVGWQGALTCLLPIVIVAAIAFPLCAGIGYWMMRKQMAEESEQARKPDGTSDYVGISYSNGIGLFDMQDTAWDRGWLSHADGKLVYSGRNSSFCLPLSAIVDVKECRTDLLATMMLPRVVLSWRHTDGTVEHICLEVRDAQSRKDFKRKNHELCARLDLLIKAFSDVGQEQSDAEWPFRSSVSMKALAFEPTKVTQEDKTHAFLIATLFLVCFVAVATIIQGFIWRSDFPLASAFGIIPLVVYQMVLIKRQRKRRDGDDA